MRNQRVRTTRLRRGQAMTESIILICLCMLVLLGMMTYFLNACGDFYLNVVKVICLPFP